ncbi:MAG: hypothetical protein ACI8TP_002316 [Acidimicrobiales bacterium]|jgi:hypothetical protein
METKTPFDFSVRNAPETWLEAAVEAPEGDDLPLHRKRMVGRLPARYEIDTLTACIAALAISISIGASWYLFETRNALNTPWISVVLGVFIAVAVRLGAGPDLPEVRATMSVIFYLGTILLVSYMIERTQFIQIYGSSAAIAGGERGLVRDRLTQPETVVAWGLGLLAATQLSYLLRKR